MAQVTNDSPDELQVPIYDLVVQPGETFTVDDDTAATLPQPPFKIIVSAPVAPAATVEQVAPVAPVVPSGDGQPPAQGPTVSAGGSAQ